MGSSYILRNLDAKIWEPFKARAQKDGHNLKYIILRLVTFYVKHGFPDGLPAIEEKLKR